MPPSSFFVNCCFLIDLLVDGSWSLMTVVERQMRADGVDPMSMLMVTMIRKKNILESWGV
jgi:hypothetical protein